MPAARAAGSLCESFIRLSVGGPAEAGDQQDVFAGASSRGAQIHRVPPELREDAVAADGEQLITFRERLTVAVERINKAPFLGVSIGNFV